MTMAMDNFEVSIRAWKGHVDFDMLQLAMRVAFAEDNPRIGACVYRVAPAKLQKVADPRQPPKIEQPAVLIFGWNAAMVGAVTLPFKLDYIAAADFAQRWLAEQQYGPEPDHDGDNSKGWHVRAGHRLVPDSYAICSVEPIWAEHGK